MNEGRRRRKFIIRRNKLLLIRIKLSAKRSQHTHTRQREKNTPKYHTIDWSIQRIPSIDYVSVVNTIDNELMLHVWIDRGNIYIYIENERKTNNNTPIDCRNTPCKSVDVLRKNNVLLVSIGWPNSWRFHTLPFSPHMRTEPENAHITSTPNSTHIHSLFAEWK